MLDQLLSVIAILAWVWFFVFLGLIALRTYQVKGFSPAIRAIFSLRVTIAFLLALGLSLLSASLVFIEPQEAAVVISVLQPNGYREQPLRSGLHAIVPLAEKVIRYPTYWQTYTMSTEPMEGDKPGNDTISARTSDGQLVYLDSSVIYRIDANEVIKVHRDWQDRYIDSFIRTVMRGIIRTEVSQFTADEINSSKRKNLELNLEDLLREEFDDKGFVLDRFLLRNIAFSPQYAAAIEQKQVAEQDRTQREYQAEQIRIMAGGERDRLMIEAQGRADAIEIEAQAQATAIVLKGQADSVALNEVNKAISQNPALVVFRYIDKLAPNIKAMLVPNNAPYLLPLPSDVFSEMQMGTPVAPFTNTLPVLSTPLGTPTPTVTATPTPAPASP
jgi:regulator of protease activity HflC (stomatin/prohibitin superfamily)